MVAILLTLMSLLELFQLVLITRDYLFNAAIGRGDAGQRVLLLELGTCRDPCGPSHPEAPSGGARWGSRRAVTHPAMVPTFPAVSLGVG